MTSYLKGPMFKATNKTTAKTHVDFFMVLVNSGCLLRKRVFCSKNLEKMYTKILIMRMEYIKCIYNAS